MVITQLARKVKEGKMKNNEIDSSRIIRETHEPMKSSFKVSESYSWNLRTSMFSGKLEQV